MTASEGPKPARLVPDGLKRPAHQPTYTAHMGTGRYWVVCECEWTQSARSWAGVEYLFREHLLERARRAEGRA